jgi:hypothetical protein
MSKKGFEMSFGWMFAIIAGMVIIFLAIYFSVRFINLQQTTVGAETSKQIGILLDPLETSFDESAQTTSFTISPESRIYNICDDFGTFGTQTIQLAQNSFNKWTKTNVDVSFENKYLFSDSQVQGKNFFIFSKPFNMPFKVADLIYLTSSEKQYCFENAPSNIEEELNNLNQSNLLTKNCSTDSVKVCFNGNNCDVNVENGYVEKNGSSLNFYSDALMYAAIFSDKDVYECQLKRLMERNYELTSLYQDKLAIVSGITCSSNFQNDLIQLSDYASGYKNSGDIATIGSFADNLNQENEDPHCLVW